MLVEHSAYNRCNLKQRLYDAELKDRMCELCGQNEYWNESHMSLILDHVNGVADDNRLENLRIVCANCNATLDTHCGRQNRRPVEESVCLRCGRTFSRLNRRQRYCSRSCGTRYDRTDRRKVARPPYEQLVAEVAATSWSAVGRRYGVSDNAVRKWVRAYERERRGASLVVVGVDWFD